MIFHSFSSKHTDLIIIYFLVDPPTASKVFLLSLYTIETLYFRQEAVVTFVYERFKSFELQF